MKNNDWIFEINNLFIKFRKSFFFVFHLKNAHTVWNERIPVNWLHMQNYFKFTCSNHQSFYWMFYHECSSLNNPHEDNLLVCNSCESNEFTRKGELSGTCRCAPSPMLVLQNCWLMLLVLSQEVTIFRDLRDFWSFCMESSRS